MNVQSLHIYPIKSCYRVDLKEAIVTETGLANDRRWMLVDENGLFLSQRKYPKMALIRPQVHNDHLEVQFVGEIPPLKIPLYTEEHGQRKVQIWKSECLVQDYGDNIASVFSKFLGTACRLVTMDQNFQRKITSSKAVGEGIVSFADAYPYLLTTQESLNALNDKLEEKIPMTRFRSNIVIEGSSQAFAEDHWGKIQIGNAEFFCPKKCARCKVITIDQEKGETLSGEPLKALAGFRMVDRQVLFGHNLQHDPKSANTIKVGDSLTVLA